MIVDRLGDVVTIAGETCGGVISLISHTISFSFNLSFFIGQLIVKFGVTLISFLVECVFTLQTLFKVLAEDYFVFLSDVWSSVLVLGQLLLNACESVSHTLFGIFSTFLNVVQSLQNFSLYSMCSLIEFIESIFCAIHYCLLVIKNAIVLLGLTSWDLLVFFPHSIIRMKRFLVSFLLHFMINIRDTLKSARKSTQKILYGVFIFVTDIPSESLYGLLACLILAVVLVKYHQSLRPVLARHVFYILNQCQRTLMTAWTYLEAFTLWLLTNQMTPSLNGARYFAPEVDVPGGGNMPNTGQNVDEDERRRAEREHPDIFERKPPQEPEDRLCVVCQDSERCTIILPCRHVCLCYDCCGVIKRTHGRCPICRHVVRRTMRVYIN